MNNVQGFKKYLYYDIILASDNSAYPPPRKKEKKERSVDCRPEKVKIRGEKERKKKIWLRLLSISMEMMGSVMMEERKKRGEGDGGTLTFFPSL